MERVIVLWMGLENARRGSLDCMSGNCIQSLIDLPGRELSWVTNPMTVFYDRQMEPEVELSYDR